VKNSKGVRRSRERGAAFAAKKTLGRHKLGQRAAEFEKRERGWEVSKGTPPARIRNLGGEEAQGGIRKGTLVNDQASGRDCPGVTSPEGRVGRTEKALLISKRVAAFEKTYGMRAGEKPRRENPKSGSGMKQARKVVRGAKHREGEKP
jgi:hypothetical protein